MTKQRLSDDSGVTRSQSAKSMHVYLDGSGFPLGKISEFRASTDVH